jgi:hypothetical protein
MVLHPPKKIQKPPKTVYDLLACLDPINAVIGPLENKKVVKFLVFDG